MRISVFGLGYVGCTTGACLAEMGYQVLGVEPNPVKVDLINAGKAPVVEDGLDKLVASVVHKGRFVATSDWKKATRETDLAMVSVGTPSRSNGSIDPSFVRRVCEQIGQGLAQRDDYFTVVIRSTVLPGTSEGMVIPTLEEFSGRKVGVHFGVCMNPEFLREGSSIHDFYNPPKTVIGQYDLRSGDAPACLYEELPGPKIRTVLRVAEMVKYADNAFHALKVAFANEIGNVCREARIDGHKVMEIFCLDTKLNLSPYYLKPGFAFGGSCLPKDLRALTYEAKTLDLEVPVLNAILESNKRQILKVVNKLLSYKGRSLGFLGLSFKGGTDDMRESPTVQVIEAMLGKGFTVRVYDKDVSLARLMGANKEYIEREIPHISKLMCSSARELVEQSDVIVVGHNDAEFRRALGLLKPGQALVDLVRITNSSTARNGEYYGICW
ncbi:MAG TPA: UDP-glucose/GDP-mannose dehydrogenase family protein [Candidatus Acidoferrales bacterium]|jgi:GDP-mannose 6-dehydrogenase|nr:UDP-glucose/GDP-mannose dehydrogenase family protein [Candidatus Acidoferrales bacterium]